MPGPDYTGEQDRLGSCHGGIYHLVEKRDGKNIKKTNKRKRISSNDCYDENKYNAKYSRYLFCVIAVTLKLTVSHDLVNAHLGDFLTSLSYVASSGITQ